MAAAGNGGGVLPSEKSPLTAAVVREFGTYDRLKEEFTKRAAAIPGSGWEWLGLDPVTKVISLQESRNQDMIEPNGLVPLLTVDVWEHAYYLQYKNLRPDYLKEIWKVINWREVEDRYIRATQ